MMKLDFNKTYWDNFVVKISDEFTCSSEFSLQQLSSLMIVKYEIPEFAQNDFKNYFQDLYELNQHLYQDNIINDSFEQLDLDTDIDNYVDKIKSLYFNTWNIYAHPCPQSDAEIFGNSYLRLVESGTEAMGSIARLELQFSRALSEKVAQRDMVLANLDNNHMELMQQLDQNPDGHQKSQELNNCEQNYYRERMKTEIHWNSDITALREHQRRDFRDYVMQASSDLLLRNDNNCPNDAINRDIPVSPLITSTSSNTNSSTTASAASTTVATSQKLEKIKRSFSSSTGLISSINKRLGISNASSIQSDTIQSNGQSDTMSNQSGSSLAASIGATVTTVNPSVYYPTSISITTAAELPWQESFTVNLGRQMRSSHNMRIIAIDPCTILQLSKQHPIESVGGSISSASVISSSVHQFNGLNSNNNSSISGNNINTERHSEEIIANRLNTALSLYSHNLSAMVVLVDNRLSTYNGFKKQFSDICERSTDFHFPQLENQLEDIRRAIRTSNSNSGKLSDTLEPGDVYVTRHSNLNVVSVVFHLVIDQSKMQNDIKYPSPIHSALRNILRTCFLHDIFLVNIPLLMAHQLKDYMTSSWCVKRVETILKAIKGSLMELCTWKGQENRTIQFLVPPGLSPDLLVNFSNLLTEYFQPYRPVK